MIRRRLTAILGATALGISLMPADARAAPTPAGPVPTVTAVPTAAKIANVRIATFNVRTARAKDKRSWLARVSDVSREILSRRPGVVLLQELGPGRADGKKAKINGAARQTTSLTARLKQLGGGQYRLVRSTSYIAPGTKHGTQGARILYDASRIALLSRCPETTGKKNYNSSCAFDLPVAAGDTASDRRSAAYAQFRDRRSGRQFWVVSAHLDNRHGSKANDAKFSRLRVRQAAAVDSRLARLNGAGLPVVFGGDINSWSTDRSRYAPHRYLRSKGYQDSVAAPNPINHLYPTVNHWRTNLKKTKNGVRLDVVMGKGAKAFTRWENKFTQGDTTRPSDHNMVLADVRL
jgi:endonuclease/exonuclease/phosphatase family metal-dependent hydrolase